MPTCLSEDDTQFAEFSLGDTLGRLRRTLDHALQKEEQAEQQFRSWQAKWAMNRDQLAQRLEYVDCELERLAAPRRTVPQLSLIQECQ